MESRMPRKILIFFIAILLLDCVSAVNIEFLKDNYMAGDSVQTWIDLENLSLINPLGYSNIKLYDGSTKIPLNLNLYKIDGKYFVYLILPELEAKDYNFVLENLLYTEKNTLKKGSFSKNLTVIGGKGVSVMPALVYLNIEAWENPRLSFEIRNKAAENMNLSFETNSEYLHFNKEDYILKPSETYLLSMIVDMKTYPDDRLDAELVVKYSDLSYSIPIIINKPFSELISSGGRVSEENFSIVPDTIISEGELKFIEDADKVERSLRKENNLEGPLRFKNFGNKAVYGLKFELTNNLDKIVRYKYDGDYIVEGNEQESIYLYINENRDIDKNYSGDLIVEAEGRQIKFPIILSYVPEQAIENQSTNLNQSYYSPPNYTRMPVIEKKSNTFIFILFGVFFVILLYLIYYFYKKGKPETKKFESLIPTFSKR